MTKWFSGHCEIGATLLVLHSRAWLWWGDTNAQAVWIFTVVEKDKGQRKRFMEDSLRAQRYVWRKVVDETAKPKEAKHIYKMRIEVGRYIYRAVCGNAVGIPMNVREGSGDDE